MKITKFGHACFLAEINGVNVLADPGNWNKPVEAAKLDAIVITHEHMDHCDPEQIKDLLAKHPGVRIITHEAVGKLLEEAGFTYEKIEPGQVIDVNGLAIESVGTDHAVIYGGVVPCRNTGFMLGDELFITGDAIHDIPTRQVRVLALPTGGPWMKIGEALEYAKAVKPKAVFSVHDAMYTDMFSSQFLPRMVGGILEKEGITYVPVEIGKEVEV